MTTSAAAEGLRVEALTKRFQGLVALSEVSFTAPRGAITGLIGPNGSGKTTLFNIVSGFLRPTCGRVFFDGQDITAVPPHRMAALRIARTFQTPQPFASLTVGETVALAASLDPQARDGGEGRAVAEAVGLAAKLDRYPRELTTADLNRLELAKALATGAQFVLLDEVFAGLNPVEIERIIEVIRRYAAGGLSFLVIEHRMRAVMALCDRLHVLLFGRLAASGTPAEVTADPQVINAYLGTQALAHA